jgi:hypothetical protein
MTERVSFSFSSHVALLAALLARRGPIAEAIEGRLLNVQGKEISRSRNRAHFAQILDSCFFDAPGLPRDLARVKGRLAAAHVADGFEPVLLDRRSHHFDPLELIARAYDHWERRRWPGRNGRLTYARSLFAAFVLSQLQSLSLRIWDDGDEQAAGHLREIQLLLDTLNDATASNVFVRDARWLIQTAQGPLTRDLEPYFRIAAQVSRSLAHSDRLELHKAGARLAGGHLRSQLRYRTWETQRSIGDPDVLAITRNSNSMDGALLVRDLVALLEAYAAACLAGDQEERLDLADAILQGVSADPELFLTRLDHLAPCTMIEELFIDRKDDDSAGYSTMGREHVALVARYSQLIAQQAQPLMDDAARLSPAGCAYSPFAIAYGFCADILSNMMIDGLVARPVHDVSLEDIFISRGNLDPVRARALGWEQLPRREDEREHFDHSIEWAELIFKRLTDALRARASHEAAPNASNVAGGRLFILSESQAGESLPEGFLPEGIVAAQEHLVTSDLQRALSIGATAFPRSQIASDRKEARFLASVESEGKWFGISKVVLTACTSQGKDALITGVPSRVIEVLRLTAADLLVLP